MDGRQTGLPAPFHDRLSVVVVEPVIDPGEDLVDPVDQIANDLGIGDQRRQDGQTGLVSFVGTDCGAGLADKVTP